MGGISTQGSNACSTKIRGKGEVKKIASSVIQGPAFPVKYALISHYILYATTDSDWRPVSLPIGTPVRKLIMIKALVWIAGGENSLGVRPGFQDAR